LLVSSLYLVVFRRFALLVLLGRNDRSKALEILVLRHELIILFRHAGPPSGSESSINGSISTAYWSSCKLRRQKAASCTAFAKPSSGLEPETPPYHGIRAATGRNPRQSGLFLAVGIAALLAFVALGSVVIVASSVVEDRQVE
jgi:hypothetical protein